MISIKQWWVSFRHRISNLFWHTQEAPVAGPPISAEHGRLDDNERKMLDGLYAAYRQYLNHEHSLINQRLSWNFTIQGFLFGAYAFVLNKTADVRGELTKVSADGVDILLGALHDLQILLLVIGLAGFCASIAVHLSVWGARRSMNELRERWTRMKFTEEETVDRVSLSCGYPPIMGGGDPKATTLGFHASTFLSVAFAAAWFVLIADALFF
jgi:hypothetical protein